MDSNTLTLVSLCLTAITVGGTILATILTRKGKKEDMKLAERQNDFSNLTALFEARGQEIERLKDARMDDEARAARQRERCNATTEVLASALTAHKPADPVAEKALQKLRRHREDDHPELFEGRGGRT